MEKKKYEISNRRTSPSFRLYRQASHVYSTCILNFFPIIRDFSAVVRTLSAFTEKKPFLYTRWKKVKPIQNRRKILASERHKCLLNPICSLLKVIDFFILSENSETKFSIDGQWQESGFLVDECTVHDKDASQPQMAACKNTNKYSRLSAKMLYLVRIQVVAS